MATQTVSLSIVPGAAGPAVAVQDLAAQKTITVDGLSGAPIDIQAGINGKFCTIFTFVPGQGARKEVTLDVICDQMRVVAPASSSGLGVSVAAERSASQFVSLPAGQPGASVDVTQLGDLNTLIAPTGNTYLEISNDGGTTWSQVSRTYTATPGCETKKFSAKLARAVGDSMELGAQETSVGAVLSEPRQSIIFRPNATGANAPGGNVYPVWADAYAAARALVPFGTVELEIDSRFAPGPLFAIIPDGVWDMRGIILTTPNAKAGGFLQTLVTISDNARLDGLTCVKPKPASGMITVYNGTGGPCIQNTTFLRLGLVRMRNFNPAASPYLSPNLGTLTIILDEESNTVVFDGSQAPVLDLAGGFVAITQLNGLIRNGMITDSVGGGLLDWREQSPAQTGGGSAFSYNFPGLAGSIALNDLKAHRNRFQPYLNPVPGGSPIVQAADSPFTITTLLNTVEVDSSAGPVIVNLMPQQLKAGEDVTIKDVGGQAAVNNITVQTPAGSAFEDGSTSVVISTNYAKAQFRGSAVPGVWLRL